MLMNIYNANYVGIWLNKALVFAHEDEATYGALLKSVTGVIFLGTPHRGSNAATLGTVVGGIVNTFVPGFPTKTVRTDLLDYLKEGSRQLHDLATSARNRLANLTVISFYESEAQYPMSLVSIAATTKHTPANAVTDRRPIFRRFEYTWGGHHPPFCEPPRSL